jgi:DNA-binding FrmR family transcriptional regulator
MSVAAAVIVSASVHVIAVGRVDGLVVNVRFGSRQGDAFLVPEWRTIPPQGTEGVLERSKDMRGYYADRDEIIGRLRRIEGQVRGLQRMVETDEYCIDILTQITAASNALKKVAVGLLDDHIRHCVAQGSEEGKDMVREATAAIERLVKA